VTPPHKLLSAQSWFANLDEVVPTKIATKTGRFEKRSLCMIYWRLLMGTPVGNRKLESSDPTHRVTLVHKK